MSFLDPEADDEAQGQNTFFHLANLADPTYLQRMHLQVPLGRKGAPGEKDARLPLTRSPLEVAAGLRHCKGLVFLDSAVALPGALSIVAAEPEAIYVGESFSHLEREIAKKRHCEGAAMGWISYEGELCFGFYDHLLIYDHSLGKWSGSESLAAKVRQPTPTLAQQPLVFSSSLDRKTYQAQVVAAQAFISSGDIYQANLTYPFHARWSGDAFALFASLRRSSPAPFSAFLTLDDTEIISSSPELFLKMSDREITTRPIKGTRPRFHDLERDARSVEELLASAKEIAELTMITDLERNDLGRICEYGSVRVSELLKLERYEQIYHLSSTVEGVLRKDVSHVSALQSCFPGGSITGAPKKRAREIIQQIEQRKRGIYTGALGYFGYGRESQFAIAIRTICKKGDDVTFSVGAGIVADSDPAKEYQETLDKAAGILLAARQLSQAQSDG